MEIQFKIIICTLWAMLGIGIFGIGSGKFPFKMTDDQLIDQRAKELYIEYKACEKVEAMINAGK